MTPWHAAAFGVLGDMDLALCAAGVALGDTCTCTLRGRCGTYGTGLAHGGALGSQLTRCGRRGFLHGRHGKLCDDPPSLCVAGVARGDMDRALCVAGVALMALGWLWWRAWFPVDALGRRGVLRGRRGTW